MKSLYKSRRCVLLTTIAAFLFHTVAFAVEVKLPTNTRVYVETTESLVAKGGKVNKGDFVGSKVWRDVIVNSIVLIAAGTPVTARIDDVRKRRMVGIKGTMTIGAYETQSVDGQTIQLSGRYHKEGKSRMAGAIIGGLIFLPLIFIHGGAAELPAGSVFDVYVDRSWQIDVGDDPANRVVDLTTFSLDTISAKLLYERLAEQEKPKDFEFLVVITEPAPRPLVIQRITLVIDRINGVSIRPVKLNVVSEVIEDDEVTINAIVRIETVIEKFRRGINTVEISYRQGDRRISTEVIINIQI